MRSVEPIFVSMVNRRSSVALRKVNKSVKKRNLGKEKQRSDLPLAEIAKTTRRAKTLSIFIWSKTKTLKLKLNFTNEYSIFIGRNVEAFF
jgi:hypothetical protein